MKWFRNPAWRKLIISTSVLVTVCAGTAAVRPLWRGHSFLFTPAFGWHRWIDSVPAGSDVEKALYRVMQLPGGDVLFRRPPRETVPALTSLQQVQRTAALYSLRALEEEQALDFTAAERDWKAFADQASDPAAAHLDLADFYERRLQPQAEITALEWTGALPEDAHERWTAVPSQRSWKAFERALKVVNEYALPRSESASIYAAWIKRYPQEPEAYRRQFAFLLEGKRFAEAADVMAHYRGTFPADAVFPVQAEADLAVKKGHATDGLSVYDTRFEPLWPAPLIKSYFGLVLQSRNQRAFGDALRAKLAANPDDWKDAARLFYLYQQQGQLDSAKGVFSRYREQKEARDGHWNADELLTFEKLFEAVQDFPEAARYAYALAADHSSADSERKGVVALTRILLTAPEQPLRIGAGNLALYKNIATMDRGPGYLNGILSLLLNTQSPREEYATEDQLATPYFHRARAAELLAQIDRRFADEPARPQLHASLMEAYAVYGENQSVIREGTATLATFPHFGGRVHVALSLADAYERTNQVDQEFAVYQGLLKELAAQADGVPLGDAGDTYNKALTSDDSADQTLSLPAPEKTADDATASNEGSSEAASRVEVAGSKSAPTQRSALYAQVLDRYLGRLVSLQRLPEALSVLRGELDRNPQDPGLYEKLADFLQQNALNSHEEEVFQSAIQQFQDTTWYAKLARFYLRQKRNADYSALMHKVADTFSGTELESFLQQAPAPDQTLALQVNLYASQHFPHDLHFVEQLAAAYGRKGNHADLEKLLWDHWSESPNLRNQLFEMLSHAGKLDAQLTKLRQVTPEIEKADWTGLATRNPAAERFWLEASLWQSHFEQGVAAADALATAYPGDTTIGEQASSLYRSLAYFHPEDTDKAVAIQKRLLEAQPGNLDTLAKIGDIYADHSRFGDAAPFWVRMAEVHPGEADGYLQSATVFWDYFDFASAQVQLERARSRLDDPTLFGYQQGAIDESRGNLAAAVRAYAASAAADSSSPESRDRLLALARKAGLRAVVEEGTSGLLKQAAPGEAAIELRAGILEAERRKEDLVHELEGAIHQTTSFDVLESITRAARSHALNEVEVAATRREIALTTDPVRHLQLRYELVSLLQQRNGAAAAQEIGAIYHDNNKILGVVRSTVDYDWDHHRQPQAVEILLDAAKGSYPELRSSFELEAAHKLTDLNEYERAHTLLASLLEAKPLDAGFEAAMADNYARSNDPSGLEAFYRAQLERVQQAKLGHDEKQQRVAQLRRGMILAATGLHKFDAAIDQYIELINTFPDDAALTQEAALFAVAHDGRDHLFKYYRKTITDSPRDPRWSIVLARAATAAEETALAIDSYSKALHLRPERQDLYIAQASLDIRMHHFDEAIQLYTKLYILSYRDPQWMEKVAELSARQGRNADAVKALETGWIEGKPAKAANSFAVAQRLEAWGLLDEAQKYALQGVDQAGVDLLVSEQAGAATYARVMARLRKSDTAMARLVSARDGAPGLTLRSVAQQVVKDGPGAVTSEEWRKQREEERRRRARAGFALALNTMAGAVKEFYTPEEKSGFAALLKQRSSNADTEELSAVYLPAAKSAELVELTAAMEWTLALHGNEGQSPDFSNWLQLQKQRVLMDAAAAQLEKAATFTKDDNRSVMWREAASAYRDAGNTVGELRMTEHLNSAEPMQDDALDRYYQLLLAQRPEGLVQVAAHEDSAAQYLILHGKPELALRGIVARAHDRPPVWKDAFTGLAGLYLREHHDEIRTAFSNALNTEANIGERIGKPADRQRQLAGEVWFSYGSRYAEYLDEEKNPQSSDYLDAELENTPGNASAYLRLADYSSQAGRPEAALADYRHSLDLRRDQPAALDSIATLEWDRGHHDEALVAWAEAIHLFAEEMDARHVPETFWGDFVRVIGNISAHGQYESVRQPVDSMLRIYVARNGNYRTEPLLKTAYQANHNSLDWLFSITASASNQRELLFSLLPQAWSSEAPWIEKAQISSIYKRIIDLAQRDTQANPGGYDESTSMRVRYIDALLNEKQNAAAAVALAEISEQQRRLPEWLPSLLAVSQANGTLNQLIAQWEKQPSEAPSDSQLRSAASNLSMSSKRVVQRFTYQRGLDRHELTAVNFLGLAAIDLDENDTPGAVELLKRLTLVSDDVYTDTDAAARWLEDRLKFAEALYFLKPLADASPWVAGYKVRLAKAKLALDAKDKEALDRLTAVANDAKAPYNERTSAALALKGRGEPDSGSDELKLLQQPGCPAVEAASKPFFVEARIAAANCATTAKSKEHLLHEALSIHPQKVSLRLSYIWSAFAANFDSRALVAADPYLEGSYYGRSNEMDSGNDSETDVSGGFSENREGEAGPNFDESATAPSLAALKPAQAVKLIELAATAYQRRHDLVNASRIVGVAINTLRDAESRKGLLVRQKQFDLEQARAHENEIRSPHIREEVDQDRVVRPRLLPGMPVPIQAKEEQP